MRTSELRQQEAVLLAHPLVARVADQVDARILFVKGPTAVALGARPARPSSDVDALVEPAGFDDLCAGLERCGWVLRHERPPWTRSAEFAFEHSAHYIHAEWPCDLDVHYLFPGFLAPPDEVFDALWEVRANVPIAGQSVPSAGFLGQSLVVGLHALRDPGKDTSIADLDHLASAWDLLPPDQGARLVELARQTGSSGTAAGLFDRIGLVPAPLSAHESRRLADWRLRQEGFGRSTVWLAELQQAGWRERPRVLKQALLPPRDHLLSSHVAGQAGRWRLAALHARRWARGLAALPHAVGVLARRRGAARS